MHLSSAIAVFASVGLFTISGFSQSADEQPSLDRLLATVEAHWQAIADRDRQRASNDLLDETKRPAFIGLNPLPMRNATVLSMQLAEPNRIVVAVQVDAVQPGQVFPLRFEQEWIAEEGEWRLVFNEPESARAAFSLEGPAPESDANQTLVDTYLDAFTLQTGEIVIPEDAFGRTVEGTIAYTYDGEHTLNLEAVTGPEQVAINRLDLRGIRPGEGTIGYTVVGDLLLTNDLPDVVFEIRSGSVTGEFRIPVRWEGVPDYRVTWIPESITPDHEGPIVLELENVRDGLWTPKLAWTTEPVNLVEGPDSPIAEGEVAVYRFESTAILTDPVFVDIDLNVRTLSLAIPVEFPSQESSADAFRQEIERLRRSVPTPPLP